MTLSILIILGALLALFAYFRKKEEGVEMWGKERWDHEYTIHLINQQERK